MLVSGIVVRVLVGVLVIGPAVRVLVGSVGAVMVCVLVGPLMAQVPVISKCPQATELT